MSYVTGSMTKLNNDEILVYQLVLSPVQPKEVTSISKKILTNENLEVHLQKPKSKTATLLI